MTIYQNKLSINSTNQKYNAGDIGKINVYTVDSFDFRFSNCWSVCCQPGILLWLLVLWYWLLG